MTPKAFLEGLKTAITDFDQRPFKTSTFDESQYQIKKKALLGAADLMLAVEGSLNLLKIRKNLLAANQLLIDPWAFTNNYVPFIIGEKNKKFIQDIYLPHLQMVKTVDFPTLALPFLSKALKTIDEIIKETQETITKPETKPSSVSMTLYHASPAKITVIKATSRAAHPTSTKGPKV